MFARNGRLWWFVLGATLVVAALAVVLRFLLVTHDPSMISTVLGTILPVLTLAVGFLHRLWRWSRAAVPDPAQLARAADDLAGAVRARWDGVMRSNRLTQELALRWEATQHPVTGPAAAPPAGSAALRTEGALPELFAVYDGQVAERIILLGEPGAGKTSAAILLLVQSLKRRAAMDVDDASRVPVPVICGHRRWSCRYWRRSCWSGRSPTC